MPFPTISILESLDPVLRGQLGGLLENMALISLQSEDWSRNSISSWKKNSKEQVEVDFVLKHDTSIPIEVKSALTVNSRHFSNVKKYLELTAGKVGFLVSAAPFKILREGGVTLVNLPIYLVSIESIVKIKSLLDTGPP